jgi:mRNA interferase MazF
VICNQGDVVVVPFPFVDRPIAKFRPAVVLSTHDFNAANDHTILAMITTAARSGWPSDIEIGEQAEAGINHRSFVRWKVFTLPNQLVARMIGKLGPRDQAAVSRAVRANLTG